MWLLCQLTAKMLSNKNHNIVFILNRLRNCVKSINKLLTHFSRLEKEAEKKNKQEHLVACDAHKQIEFQ